jgi:hypothetical protein
LALAEWDPHPRYDRTTQTGVNQFTCGRDCLSAVSGLRPQTTSAESQNAYQALRAVQLCEGWRPWPMSSDRVVHTQNFQCFKTENPLLGSKLQDDLARPLLGRDDPALSLTSKHRGCRPVDYRHGFSKPQLMLPVPHVNFGFASSDFRALAISSSR